MPDIFTATGDGTFGVPREQAEADRAYAEWQAHLDAGRLTRRKPTPRHIRARHEHNHRVLGLRVPGT